MIYFCTNEHDILFTKCTAPTTAYVLSLGLRTHNCLNQKAKRTKF